MGAGTTGVATEMISAVTIKGDRVFLNIKASPNASKTAFSGIQDGRIRIRVAAAPEDGKANAEIRSFLAKTVGCPKSAVTLETGEKSKLKTFSFPAEYSSELEKLLIVG